MAGAKAQAFIERAWTSSPTKVVALFIGSPFHECGVAAGCLDTAIVGLIRGYACRRGFQLFMSCSYRLASAAGATRVHRLSFRRGSPSRSNGLPSAEMRHGRILNCEDERRRDTPRSPQEG